MTPLRVCCAKPKPRDRWESHCNNGGSEWSEGAKKRAESARQDHRICPGQEDTAEAHWPGRCSGCDEKPRRATAASGGQFRRHLGDSHHAVMITIIKCGSELTSRETMYFIVVKYTEHKHLLF